ncbi:MAG: hypothetical protein ACI861_001495 [Paracoccaceae bacterium]|jgi:hypothetical protein
MAAYKAKTAQSKVPKRMSRGFVQTGGILHQRIRKTAEKRGFVETRLLTHWAEFVGEATAAITRPVKVGYGRQGLGATLTVLTNGANAPMLQAELPKIRERVNACYGYAAISQIRLTQTSATGFAEQQAAFSPKVKPNAPPPNPEKTAAMNDQVANVESNELRSALAALGQNILTRNQN